LLHVKVLGWRNTERCAGPNLLFSAEVIARCVSRDGKTTTFCIRLALQDC
jgi:hypothetical protein